MEHGIGGSARRPTMRAADKWDSARFLSLFLAWSFSGSQAESRPAHLRLTSAVGQFKNVVNRDMPAKTNRYTIC
jgi:hypothetical protein